MAEAPRDGNYVPVMMGIDSVTGLPRPLEIDNATGSLKMTLV